MTTTTYRITTQIVNPDGSLGDVVAIMELESYLTPEEVVRPVSGLCSAHSAASRFAVILDKAECASAGPVCLLRRH